MVKTYFVNARYQNIKKNHVLFLINSKFWNSGNVRIPSPLHTVYMIFLTVVLLWRKCFSSRSFYKIYQPFSCQVILKFIRVYIEASCLKFVQALQARTATEYNRSHQSKKDGTVILITSKFPPTDNQLTRCT